jgi:hypothetical protein
MGIERKVFRALRRKSRIHGGLLLDGADVVDGALAQAGAGVEFVGDVVLEVAPGLVDAGDGVGGGQILDGGGRG